MRKERLKGALRPELYVPLPLKSTRPHHHKEKPQNLNEKRPHMIIFNVSANFIHILSHQSVHYYYYYYRCLKKLLEYTF